MSDAALVDLTAMMEDVGEEELVYEILAAYLDETEQRIPTLREAVKNKDFDTAVREAHSIKGGALNFSCRALADPGLRLEQMAKAREFDDPESLIQAVEEGYKAVRNYLNKQLEG